MRSESTPASHVLSIAPVPSARLLERPGKYVAHHPWRVIAVMLAIALIAVVAATRLRLDPDMLNFLPAETREVREFRQVLAALGTLDQHIVAIDIPRGAPAAEYTSLVDDLARELGALPDIRKVDSRLPDLRASIDALLPKATLFLTPSEAEALRPKLTDAAIDEAMAANVALLQTPQSSVAKEWIRLDPLRLSTVVLQRLSQAGGGFRFDTSSGYFLSADRTTYAILARPSRPAHDLPFSAQLMRESREIADRAIARFRKDHPQLPPPTIAFAGGYAISVDDAELIRKDVAGNVAFSFIGVLVLFVIAFRRPIALLYAAVPMGWAIILTFAIAALATKALSSAAAGFAALLAGLGIDFITVYYSRCVEERRAGKSVAEAIVTTTRVTLPGIIVAAVTTSITFYAFLFTEFRGMTQMGWLTASGILLFLIAVALLLPALIAVTARDRNAAPPSSTSFGSATLVRISVAYPRRTIAAWIAVMIVCGIASFGLQFNDDPANIRAHGNRGVETQERLAKKFGQSFDFVLLVASGATPEEALVKSERLLPRLRQLAEKKVIGGAQSLASFVPSPATQREVIARLQPLANDRDRIVDSLERAATKHGFREGAFHSSAQTLYAALGVSEPLRIEEASDPAMTLLRERFLQRSGSQWLSVTYLYPPRGKWGQSVAPELVALANSERGITLTGLNVVSGALRRIARADAIRATSVGLVVVFVLFLFVFRSARTAGLLFLPLIAGCIGTTGVMELAGLPFNPLNVFVGLMLIGVGTDYAVYMVERLHESPSAFLEGAPETAKAVTMAALTTIVGYGSFAISHYPGLRSIGYASTFGVAISGLAAITLLPAIFTLVRNRR